MLRESLPKRVLGFVVQELTAAELGLKVMKRPAKLSVERYGLLAASGVIMVHYAGSRYEKPIGVAQDREMLFDCIVLKKSLREDSGEDEALDVLEQVSEVLAGKKHEDCTSGLYVDMDSFLSGDDEKGVLQYQVRFGCSAVMVQPMMTESEDLSLPLLVSVSADQI